MKAEPEKLLTVKEHRHFSLLPPQKRTAKEEEMRGTQEKVRTNQYSNHSPENP